MYNIVKKKPSILTTQSRVWFVTNVANNAKLTPPPSFHVDCPTYVCVPARDKTAGVNTTVHLHDARTNDGGP